MTVGAHLAELRRRVVLVMITLVVTCTVAFVAYPQILHWLQAPYCSISPHCSLYVTGPLDGLSLRIHVATYGGAFLASPVILWQVWRFVTPGLRRNEKRYVVPFMVSTIALFTCGGYFGYKIVYPAALNFLIDFGKQFQPMITIGEYTQLFLSIILGMGLIFEMPILVFFLALMGIVSAGFMWKNFRYSILIIFIIAAIVTPTTDILNMCIFAAPMIALYAISIGVAWVVHPKQRRARKEKQAS